MNELRRSATTPARGREWQMTRAVEQREFGVGV
jgi:hypothetical protein